LGDCTKLLVTLAPMAMAKIQCASTTFFVQYKELLLAMLMPNL